MEFISFLIDFILHVDKHLEAFVIAYGAWVYALLFLIIFVETGLVVMPFLPGDSLLFIVGALCGAGLMSFGAGGADPAGARRSWATSATTASAASSGPRCSSGRARASSTAGPSTRRMRSTSATAASPSSLARFMPFIRTFAPFVAGVARHDAHASSRLFNVVGALLWVVGHRAPSGYFFGNLPLVQGEPREDHLGADPDAGPDRDLRRLARPRRVGRRAEVTPLRPLARGGTRADSGCGA